MKITGDVLVMAPAERVWQVLMDPEVLCRIMTACQEAYRLDDTHYAAKVATKMKLIPVRADVQGELLEAREPEFARVNITGETSLLPGSFSGLLTVHLEEAEGATRITYAVEAAILGRLGAIGEPLIRSTVHKIAEKFAANATAYLAEQP